MKAKDIAKQHGLDSAAFTEWLKQSGYQCNSGLMGGLDLNESHDVNEVVSAFQAYDAEAKRAAAESAAQEKAAAEQAKADRQLAAQQKQQALASMLITSGFNFDGYTITKYSGYISGDDAVQVDRSNAFWNSQSVGDKLLASLVTIRRNALVELKEAAYALGCNAVIGVDFDYLTLDPQRASATGQYTVFEPYVFGVTANGNAVIIEKNGS